MAMCTPSTPVEACCTWVGEPNASLAPATNLHRYSAPAGSTKVDLSCLTSPGTMGAPANVTLTGYVWIFSNGVVDSSGNPSSSNVSVEVYKEDLSKGDGSLGAMVGSYTTTPMDKPDPVDTTWLHNCSQGCNLRQYTIKNIPTETPLIIKTSDASGGTDWATVYDYNIYFSNAQVQAGFPGVSNCPAGDACYDATAAAASDLGTVANAAGGISINGSQGLLAGEVHDCSDVRLSGATVNTDTRAETQMFYFTTDEGNPLPYTAATSTSDLSLFGAINYPTNTPIRVTAVGEDPAAPGKLLMLGTYVVQMYPGAVTALALRGRRPWQP